MDEQTTATETTTSPEPEGTEETTNEPFPDERESNDDDWDDVDLSDLKDESEEEPEPEADQPTEAEAPPAEDEPEPEEEAPLTFELKHLGETRTVGKEEVVTLAQKGLNYDHIRGERDAARQEVERLTALEDFLKELAGPNRTVEDLVDSTRASVLAEREGIDPQVALQRVKLDKERAAFEAEKKKGDAERNAKLAEQQKQQESFVRFIKDHPGLDANDIPNQVWLDVQAGKGDLATVYGKYETQKLRNEIKALKGKEAAREQNEKNRKRATGSQQSDGASPKKKDLIDLYWDDGT